MTVLAARFSNAPVMVSPDRADWLGQCLTAVQSELPKIKERMNVDTPKMQDDYWPSSDSWLAAFRPYNVKNNTLVIPVKGMLLHDFAWQLFDWATGYVYIQKAFERGMADPEVHRIALMINSGGGEVAGNFDMVDRMYAMKQEEGAKPVWSFVNEHAYSAAYSIASVGDRIVVPRTGGTGSVGVVTSHVDISGAMEKNGVKVELIFSGEHKVDGNSYAALPAPVRERIKARLDGLRGIFAGTVARNLGISVEAVMQTEALTYGADESVSVGFAHEIRPIDESLADFTNGTFNDENEEVEPMTTAAAPAAAPAAAAPAAAAAAPAATTEQATITQANVEQAKAEGTQAGVTAERARISGILGHAEAKDRSELATHLAMNTNMSVEEAAGILAASPKGTAAPAAAAPAAGIDALMSQNTPQVGAGDENAENADQGKDQLNTLLSDYRAAAGLPKAK
ncbi:head maturation protease [Pseudomonas phage PspYZU01]|uniref:Prohead protease n=1 Tax=Pseudomonas phage PspYZU01 TaxID=1983555 RepID=A0A2U7NEX2_9CAUD|nr:head maturation protease [Pseudomonas phage PspYZU01]ASD51931.1 prohead protease [Pseudomonas phage PspYZU01]